MPSDNSIYRQQSNRPCLGRSPYMQQQDVYLREDSRGNIKGVEYLSDLSGYESDQFDGYCQQNSLTAYSSSPPSRVARDRDSFGRRSAASSIPPRWRERRRSHSIGTGSNSSDVRLFPSAGETPCNHFTLPSLESLCKEGRTLNCDTPALSLQEPQRSIAKSPLLNRDIFRFIEGADAEQLAEMDLPISSLRMGEDRGGNGLWEALQGARKHWSWASGLDVRASRSEPQTWTEAGAEANFGEPGIDCSTVHASKEDAADMA